MTKATLGDVETTARGFQFIDFSDHYDKKCSLQVSSLVDEPAIWLGLDYAEPEVMASDASKVGVQTSETCGWVPYPIPKEVLLHTRMHLTEEQVRGLIHHLNNWLENGAFE
jgi:hypothetical protein